MSFTWEVGEPVRLRPGRENKADMIQNLEKSGNLMRKDLILIR